MKSTVWNYILWRAIKSRLPCKMNYLRKAINTAHFILLQHLKEEKHVTVISVLCLMPLFSMWLLVYTSGLQLEIVSFILIFYYSSNLIFHLAILSFFSPNSGCGSYIKADFCKDIICLM